MTPEQAAEFLAAIEAGQHCEHCRDLERGLREPLLRAGAAESQIDVFVLVFVVALRHSASAFSFGPGAPYPEPPHVRREYERMRRPLQRALGNLEKSFQKRTPGRILNKKTAAGVPYGVPMPTVARDAETLLSVLRDLDRMLDGRLTAQPKQKPKREAVHQLAGFVVELFRLHQLKTTASDRRVASTKAGGERWVKESPLGAVLRVALEYYGLEAPKSLARYFA